MFNRQQPQFGRNSFASFMEQQQDEGDQHDNNLASNNNDSCSTDRTPSLSGPAVTPPHQPFLKYTSPMKLVRVSDAFSNYRNSITVATNPFCCIYGKVTMSRVVVEYPTSPLTPLTPGSPPSTQHSSGSQHPTSLQTGVSPAAANYHHQSPTSSSILPPMPTHFFYLKVDDVAPTLLSQEREQHCFSREAQKRREERRGRDSSTSAAASTCNHCPDNDDDGRHGEIPNSAIIKVCGSYEFTTRAQKSIKVGGRYFFCITGSTPARRPCHLDSRLVPGQLLCCERFRRKELMAYAQNGDTSFMIASSEYRNVPNEIAVRRGTPRGYWSYSKSLPSAVQFGSWANSRTEAKRDRASWGYGLGSEEEEGDGESGSRQQDDHPQSTAFIDQEQEGEHCRSIFTPVHFGRSNPACTSSIQSSSCHRFQQTKPQPRGNSSFSAAVGAAFSRGSNGFGKQSALDHPSTSLSFGRSSTFTTGNNGPSSDTSSDNNSSSDPSSQQQRYTPPELEAE